MIRSPFNIKTDEGGVTSHANNIGGAKVALAFANYIVCISHKGRCPKELGARQ